MEQRTPWPRPTKFKLKILTVSLNWDKRKEILNLKSSATKALMMTTMMKRTKMKGATTMTATVTDNSQLPWLLTSLTPSHRFIVCKYRNTVLLMSTRSTRLLKNRSWHLQMEQNVYQAYQCSIGKSLAITLLFGWPK